MTPSWLGIGPATINAASDRRLLINDRHEAKGIARMARPVVCWPKPDVARLISALMVEAENLEAACVVVSLNQTAGKCA
jgi:hypothetical protein